MAKRRPMPSRGGGIAWAVIGALIAGGNLWTEVSRTNALKQAIKDVSVSEALQENGREILDVKHTGGLITTPAVIYRRPDKDGKRQFEGSFEPEVIEAAKRGEYKPSKAPVKISLP